MREGAEDHQILEVIQKALQGKKKQHAGRGSFYYCSYIVIGMDVLSITQNRPMILIGG